MIILKAAIITIGVEILISILEIFTSFRYPLSAYSPYAAFFGRNEYDDSLFSERVLTYIGTTPTGFMGNPNNLATVLVLFLPFFLFMKNRKVGIMASFLILLITFYSGSRGSLVAAIILFIIYMVMYNLKRFLKFIVILPLIIIVLISLCNSLRIETILLSSSRMPIIFFIALISYSHSDLACCPLSKVDLLIAICEKSCSLLLDP